MKRLFYKRHVHLSIGILLALNFTSHAEETTKTQPSPSQSGLYDRPYIHNFGRVAIGGYMEMLGSWFKEEGIDEGFSFEARRFNIFIHSSLTDYLKFTSELEFEHGTEEIAIETALLDLTLHPSFNLRSGVLLAPIGKFNITHDSPLYDILDRPLVSTEIIPSTYTDVGLGVFGDVYLPDNSSIGYDVVAINGLTEDILNDPSGATRISNGKSESIFEENANGSVAFAGRISYTSPFGFELGASSYTGIYNNFSVDGENVADKKRLTIYSADLSVKWWRITLASEFAWATIDLPNGLTDSFGDSQWGVYTDLIFTLWNGRLFHLDDASLASAIRFDFVDLNKGSLTSGAHAGDDTTRLTAGLSFRPIPEASFRIAYQYNWIQDTLDNPTRMAGIQVGVATYF